MNLQLNNKTALVTGSTAGIGLATARKLLEEGAQVIITGRTEDRIQSVIQQLKTELPNAVVRGVAVSTLR